MCDDDPIVIWHKVPSGSRLEVSVEPDPGDFIATAEYHDSSGAMESWSDEDIHPGPKSKKVSADKTTVQITITFHGGQATEARMRARIVKAGNVIHSTPWCCTVSGKKGQIARGTIIVLRAA